MYAVTFDMDTEMLKQNYHNESYNNAYLDIRKEMEARGFEWVQGSVYFGDVSKINAVSCILAVQGVSKKYSWFAPSVRDIRMLRIEEMNDLMPAVQQG